MRTNIVFTLTGPDRIGIVEEVTGALLDLGGNVQTGRMARLGGEFAILMLVSLRDERVPAVSDAFEHLVAQGYRVSVSPTGGVSADEHAGWLPYKVEVRGADHEGIIHEIARGLSERGINIESVETATTEAPISGTPLFEMTALVVVPPALADTDWTEALNEAGRLANVDIYVTAQAKR